jgi:putative transposase
MSGKRRRRHGPDEMVRTLRDADAMLNRGKAAVVTLEFLEVREATYLRWRSHYGGMKAEDANLLKLVEEDSNRLKQLVADQSSDVAAWPRGQTFSGTSARSSTSSHQRHSPFCQRAVCHGFS